VKMNGQPPKWETPVSLLPIGEQTRILREAFTRQNFPSSRVVLKDHGPDQRGFIIGDVRL
jgi:hypothetical protein